MKTAIKRFYSQRPKQSWKNCISIGDSTAERDALEELMFTRFQCSPSGVQKVVRCKTVKFLSSPSLNDLTSELELMISLFSALTHYDGDFSYDIHVNDDMEAILMYELLSHHSVARSREQTHAYSLRACVIHAPDSRRFRSLVRRIKSDTCSVLGSHGLLDDSLYVSSGSHARHEYDAETGSYPSSLASTNAWFEPRETLVFLDFDDTLFPSTWLEQVLPPSSQNTLPALHDLRIFDADAVASLTRHESVVISFLRTVAALAGEVVIVTLATPEWVESCMRNFLPRIVDELAELKIRISYAREALSRHKVRGAALEGKDVLPLMKRAAMKTAIKRFYSQRPKQSWKNCISIGDSTAERDALEELMFTRFQCSPSGVQKVVRCKTVKFLSSPSLNDLTSELELMISLFSALAHYDGDISYDIHASDDMEAILLREILSH
eukprot:TRINITY_DN10266_c0_g1_i2.p1 TRINITY_DN10266_c0_g1~~TRINITY_DN10266_c0_g1_i2.p1  ORF type:complete len:481 (-),score=59.19 TRINITY_DN10266_c0_g1_i2:90-1403(-)